MPSAATPSAASWASRAERKLLLYVGRLAMEKNTHTLFAAYRQLAARAGPACISWSSAMASSAPSSSNSAPRCPARGAHLAPYCGDPRRLAQYYRAADLFVHPGVQETFGLVTLEAQACGTPVVGIRGSYMDRIIHCGLDAWATENSPAGARRRHRRCARSPAETSPPRNSAAALPCVIPGREVFHRLFDLYRRVIAEYRPT